MTLQPGYKLTEIGIIPQEWNPVAIGEIAIVRDGTHQTPQYVPVGIPFYSVEHVTSNNFKDTKFISASEHRFLSRSNKMERGDVLMTRIGSIGVCKYIDWNVEASFYVSLALLKVTSANPKYIAFCSQSRYFRAEVEAKALPSATPKKINLGPISEIRVALPQTTAEQEAIAEALSDAGALIESLEQLITKKRQIKQGTMQQLLTGRKRLPGFAGHFQATTLGKQAHIKTGDKNNEDKNESGAYPFFVRSAYVERINSYSHDCEAILVPGEGNIGDIFHYVNGRFDVHQRVYAITDFQPGISAKFLYYYLSRYFGSWAMQNTVKATVDSLRLPTFLNFELTLPPTIEEQTTIADVLSDMDTEITELETKLYQARHVKRGMMQQLLTGRIRLV